MVLPGPKIVFCADAVPVVVGIGGGCVAGGVPVVPGVEEGPGHMRGVGEGVQDGNIGVVSCDVSCDGGCWQLGQQMSGNLGRICTGGCRPPKYGQHLFDLGVIHAAPVRQMSCPLGSTSSIGLPST